MFENRFRSLARLGKNIIDGNIKFGILNGTIQLDINSQIINFKHTNKAIIVYFYPNKKKNNLIIEYYQ